MPTDRAAGAYALLAPPHPGPLCAFAVVHVVKEQEQPWPEPELEPFNALRRKLIFFFEARRMSDPEDLANEVLMRVARKMGEGLEVSDITRYSFGVAKNVLYEQIRRQKLMVPFSGLTSKETDEITNVPDERLNPEPRLEEEEWSRIRESSLHEALKELRDDDRKLLLAYYGLMDREKVLAARKTLADRLGIDPMHLRVRIYRLRARVKKSVEEKISRKVGHDWHG
jgi:RNA polymerase sigma factor (sigma-70 family)